MEQGIRELEAAAETLMVCNDRCLYTYKDWVSIIIMSINSFNVTGIAQCCY